MSPDRMVDEAAPSPAQTCPACAGDQTEPVYHVGGVPVHSCLVFRDRQDATSIARRDLRLDYCRTCGFLFNGLFDPGVQDYAADYDGSQAASPTFNAFSDRLVAELGDRYLREGGTVVEIGCGRGEFLTALCERSGCRGVGYDPAKPVTGEGQHHERVRIVRAYFDPAVHDCHGELVICRHTLEHIARPLDLLRGLRQAIGDRPDTHLFIEVPDAGRVLREGAFWDVYYEHCCYFTQASLRRLLRASGFEPVDATLAYGDQYLTATARPTAPSDAPPPDTDNATLDEHDAVEQFIETVAKQQDHWRRVLKDNAHEGDRCVLWGGGSKAVAFLSTLGRGDAVDYVVDISPTKQGCFLPGLGQAIKPPDALVEQPPGLVIVMNPMYLDEINRDIARLGVRTRVVTL